MPTVINNIIVSPVGAAVLNTASPSAVSWIRVNADNTITYRTAAQTLSDLGAQAAGTYVTAVTGSGNIASSGGATPNITFTGVLPTANGGTAVNIASAALVLGTASSNAGQLTLSNATNAFTQTIRGTNPAASIIYDLPTTAPTLGQVLSATAPAAGVVTLSWATASSGITVGTTTITSGTTGSIGMNIGGIYSESISYRAQQAVPGNTHFGYLSATAAGGGSYTGTANTLIGSTAGAYYTTASRNVVIGSEAQRTATTTTNSVIIGGGAVTANNTTLTVAIGHNVNVPTTGSGYHTIIGAGATISGGTQSTVYGSLATVGTGDFNLVVGGNSTITGSATGSIILATGGTTSLSNTGILGSNQTYGHVDNWYFNGVTHTAPYGVNIRASGGSGTNINGANLSFYAGLPTGDGSNTASGRNGYISYWTGDVGASGTTLRSATEKARLVQGGDLVLGITSDTKGLVLKSPDGHYWRITVDNAGVLGIADTGTSIPT